MEDKTKRMWVEFNVKNDERPWVLSSDSKNFMLGRKIWVEKEKKWVMAPGASYFQDVSHMLEYIYQLGLRKNSVDNFRDLVKHSEEMKEAVMDIHKIFTTEYAKSKPIKLY